MDLRRMWVVLKVFARIDNEVLNSGRLLSRLSFGRSDKRANLYFFTGSLR
jgi:hypothetical protein